MNSLPDLSDHLKSNIYSSCEVHQDPLLNKDYISFFNTKLILEDSEPIEGTFVNVGIRPSDIAIVDKDTAGKIKADVEYVEFLGSECIFHCINRSHVFPHEKIVVSSQHINSPYEIKFVYLHPDTEKICIFNPSTKEKLDIHVKEIIESHD